MPWPALPDDLLSRFAGQPAIVAGSGPSLELANLDLLDDFPGPIFAINHAREFVVPDLWIGLDHPGSFPNAHWLERGILKFADVRHRGRGNTTGPPSPIRTEDLHDVCWIKTAHKFNENDYWDKPEVTWGMTGRRLTFFAVFRILYELGVRRAYLIGVDWKMDPKKPYSGDRRKSQSQAMQENGTFREIQGLIRRILPGMDARGFKVWNCTPGSSLDVFPFMSLEDAVSREQGFANAKT